jgi:GNAT superfamily N-acetyltransferase
MDFSKQIISIRPATVRDAATVVAILREAAGWLEANGTPMWRAGELEDAPIRAAAEEGLLFLAECNGEAAGTIKFQLEDALFWPDLPEGEAAYIHRLAVRRCFAGGAVASALMGWAVERAAGLGRRYVRLDCEAARTRLRAVYERFGFRHHSDRQVGPYFVSRYEYVVTGRAG